MWCENAIAAKARTLYGQMLSPAQYKELTHKQSVPEIAAYLKYKTFFSSVLAEVQESTVSRGLLETLLYRELFYQYAKLVKYARGNKGMYEFLVLRAEIDLIVSCLRECTSPTGRDPVAMLPVQLQPYACFDLFALAKAKTSSEMLVVLEKTPYARVLKGCQQDSAEHTAVLSVSACELALRQHYLHTMLARAEHCMADAAARQYKQLLLMQVDLQNIMFLYRMKASFRPDRSKIRANLLPFYNKLTPRMLTQMIETENVQELMALLRKGPYAKLFVAFDPQESSIESVVERALGYKWRHALRFSTDPQVVYTVFILLRGLELDNITRVIEGVRYQLSPDRIESLLCR